MGACRLLLLLVSLGWGIILPSSQITDAMKTALRELGVLYYFGAAISSHIIIECVRTNNFDDAMIIFPIIVMQSLLDSFIFWAIFVNLSEILIELKQSKQMEKHKHYLYFTRALMALIILAIADILFESAIRRQLDEYFDYTILARVCFWHFACLLMTIVVMIQWRPTVNSMIYAFVEQIPSDDYADLDISDEYSHFDKQLMHIAMDDDIEQELGGYASKTVEEQQVDARFMIGDDDDDDTWSSHEEEKEKKTGIMDLILINDEYMSDPSDTANEDENDIDNEQ